MFKAAPCISCSSERSRGEWYDLCCACAYALRSIRVCSPVSTNRRREGSIIYTQINAVVLLGLEYVCMSTNARARNGAFRQVGASRFSRNTLRAIALPAPLSSAHGNFQDFYFGGVMFARVLNADALVLLQHVENTRDAALCTHPPGRTAATSLHMT